DKVGFVGVWIYFFFSSRRRHTRSTRDWSSDVCSSDLHGLRCPYDHTSGANDVSVAPEVWSYGLRNPWRFSFDRQTSDLYIADVEIGRASCREKVEESVERQPIEEDEQS